MIKQNNLSPLVNWRYDLPASVVVVLVALPLCLGIALASGAPLFSGLIAGIVGGVVVGFLSKSPLSVSGPAAGLTTIVLAAIQEMPTFNAFLLAVFLAGAIQIVFGLLRAGMIGDFIPTSVIKGMLAAIGIILILKQIPHAFGYDSDYTGDISFWQQDGENTFSSLINAARNYISVGPFAIAFLSLFFLFCWDKFQPRFKNWLRYIPGPLIVVVFGVVMNAIFKSYFPDFAIKPAHLVAVPMSNSINDFVSHFNMPDFSFIQNQAVWFAALTIALVASIETLLSIEAIDKLDPYKRVTPTNRELMSQGIGNMVSGILGGLPVTSVIVRSSANVSSGGRTKLSAIIHGILLLLFVVTIPQWLNYIPLAALAAILIAVGFKLTKPAIYFQKYEKGFAYFIPFVVTIAAILLTDLLIGIAVGVVVGFVFVLWENFQSPITHVIDQNNHLVRFRKDLFFINKYEIKKTFADIPNGASVLIDTSRVNFIDHDNIEIINDFIAGSPYRNIKVTTKSNTDSKSAASLTEVCHA